MSKLVSFNQGNYTLKWILPFALFFMISFGISCSRTDFSNPENVITDYRTLGNEHKSEVLYDKFLSEKSKEFATKDEFVKTRNRNDTVKSTALSIKVEAIQMGFDNPSLRRFKITERRAFTSDTVTYKLYYTLINENGEWKVIWIGTLNSFATSKFVAGQYAEARKTLEKILEIDPYDGGSYSLLAWCYLRDRSLSRREWEEGFTKHAKYAVSLEPDVSEHYNTLASYYLGTGNSELAASNYKRGLEMTDNPEEKQMFYSNLAIISTGLNEFRSAEDYLQKANAINEKNPFVWFTYGNLMKEQNRYKLALKYYKKTIGLRELEAGQQGDLSYNNAYCAFRISDCAEAKKSIEKALLIDPSNYRYQQLHSSISSCGSQHDSND